MRLCVIEYALRSAVLVKPAQHPAYALIAYAGVELAVGKCARAALAELDIAFGVELTAGAERLDLCLSRFGIGTALDHYRAQSRKAEHIGGKHSSRSEAGDNGSD